MSVMARMSRPLVSFLLAAVSLVASDPPVRLADMVHRRWRGADVPFSSVFDLAQTKEGPLWLATDQGLFRFDGVRFARFDALSETRIRQLVAARDGSLWAVFRSPRVSRLFEGRVTNYSFPELERPNAIAEDRDGSFVATAARGGLTRFRDGSWQDIRSSLHLTARLSLGLWFDRDGALWLATDERLLKLPRGASVFSDAGMRPRISLGWQQIFAQTPDGTVWFASLISTRPVSPEGAPGEVKVSSNAVMTDRQGSLWIGSNEGLRRIPVHSRTTGEPPDSFTVKEGLSGNRVYCLLEDREGGVWAGTDLGLDRFSEGVFRPVPVANADRIAGLTALRDGGLLARVMGETYLDRIGRDGAIEALPLSQRVASACEDGDGRIWAGTSLGAGYWSGSRLSYPAQTAGNWINDMACGYGDVWMTDQRRGIMRFSGGKAAFIPGLRPPTMVFPDGPGVLWAAYPSGLMYVYDNGVTREYGPKDGLPQGAVRSIIKAAGGGLWLAGEGGLARYRNGRFERAAVEGGAQLDGVAEAEDGVLWLSGGGRLLKMDVREFERAARDPGYRAPVTPYGPNEGIPGTVRFVTRSGSRIWVASSDGLWYLDPDRRRAGNSLPPPVQIESVTADSKTMSASSGVTLPRLTHSLRIDYTAFSYVAPERIQFRYKLEGVDADWQDPGLRRQAYYSDPPPGKHRFWVKASNSEGVWNEAGASFDFFVAPAYYQTYWFQASCAAAFVALLWALYRFRLHQIATGFNLRMEERVAERTRLARDLHDTLLQSFHGSMLHFQVVAKLLPEGKAREQLEQAMQRADRAIAEGRSAVYDLRSSAMATNDLAEALNAAGLELSNNSTAAFNLTVEGPATDLHPIIRDEIYRISREALSNAFKHAHARHIEAEISYEPRAFRLRIRDDGEGIPAEVLEHGRAGHFGLSGMRERARQIGADLTLWSRPDAGTEIDLSLSATIAYGASPQRSPFGLFRRKMDKQ